VACSTSAGPQRCDGHACSRAAAWPGANSSAEAAFCPTAFGRCRGSSLAAHLPAAHPRPPARPSPQWQSRPRRWRRACGSSRARRRGGRARRAKGTGRAPGGTACGAPASAPTTAPTCRIWRWVLPRCWQQRSPARISDARAPWHRPRPRPRRHSCAAWSAGGQGPPPT
jgi:hypothetical protein